MNFFKKNTVERVKIAMQLETISSGHSEVQNIERWFLSRYNNLWSEFEAWDRHNYIVENFLRVDW